jgi:ribosome recycling factor
MGKCVGFFADQLIGIRSSVISPSVIDTVRVEYQGTRVPVSHIATTFSDQCRVLVQPHDPQMLGTIDKALKQAGFNAYVFSRTQVVISFSVLSGEQRARVTAHIGRLAEAAKVAVRNVRKKLAREGGKESEAALQQMTNQAVERIEGLKQGKLRSL